MRALGVVDAFKLSKESVRYSKSTGADQCRRCRHWQPDLQQASFGLAMCNIVSGSVRNDRLCTKFIAASRGLGNKLLMTFQRMRRSRRSY
jgi:hypothetical protein